jgi:hypothetical protein
MMLGRVCASFGKSTIRRHGTHLRNLDGNINRSKYIWRKHSTTSAAAVARPSTHSVFVTEHGAMFRDVPSAADRTHTSAQEFDRLRAYLRTFIDDRRIVTDLARRLAYGTDASLYRLVPALVVDVHTEDEVRRIVSYCNTHDISVTFRGAGTSLSGQASTDSVLLRVVPSRWNKMEVLDRDGTRIRLGSGVLGSSANQTLKFFKKKIGPGIEKREKRRERRKMKAFSLMFPHQILPLLTIVSSVESLQTIHRACVVACHKIHTIPFKTSAW